jgi:Peptidase of plants and bacteria
VRRILALSLTVGLFGLLWIAAATGADEAVPGVSITADASEVPGLASWAEAAQKRCELWHPLITRILGYEGEHKHREIKIVVKKEMKGIAATSGGTINVSASYVERHPNDDGMIVHELVHVVQAYPRPEPVWLTEGLADYIRYWHYEPGQRNFRITGRSSYRDSYGTTARFLAWVQVTKDEKIIQKLDAAMRKGEYRRELFQDATGKPLDELWAEFVAATQRKQAEEPAERTAPKEP